MKVKSTYVRYERIILGLCGVSFILLGWEGLERGWWSDLLRPLWGEHAESLHIKRIFISSPSLVASAAYQMFFVSGEIWSDLAASGMEFLLGLGTAVLIGVPLGLTV